MSRYGGAIEADLADRGFDLAELCAAKRHRFVLNIIDHLPRWSNYIAALADDEEAAEASADQPQGKPQPPSMREWTPEAAALADTVDRLGAIVQGIAKQLNPKKKAPEVSPYPRPVTARERVKRRREHDDHLYLVSRLVPHEHPPDEPPEQPTA